MRSSLRLLATAVLALLTVGCGHAAGHAPDLPAPRSLPRSSTSHIITIVMENKEDTQVLGSHDAPYLHRLTRRGGLATRSYGVRHPSLPNCLALTSGSTHGIASDCTDCRVAARNVVDQLETAGRLWKAYRTGS